VGTRNHNPRTRALHTPYSQLETLTRPGNAPAHTELHGTNPGNTQRHSAHPEIVYPRLQRRECSRVRNVKYEHRCKRKQERCGNTEGSGVAPGPPPADAFRKNDLVIDLYISSPAVSQMLSLTSRILDSPVTRSETGTGTLSLLNAAPVFQQEPGNWGPHPPRKRKTHTNHCTYRRFQAVIELVLGVSQHETVSASDPRFHQAPKTV
jgi:hypothetical protein